MRIFGFFGNSSRHVVFSSSSFMSSGHTRTLSVGKGSTEVVTRAIVFGEFPRDQSGDARLFHVRKEWLLWPLVRSSGSTIRRDLVSLLLTRAGGIFLSIT